MKNLALVVLTLTVLCLGLYVYGKWPRSEQTYENRQATETHAVLCISDTGAAETYHIIMPSFEGFSLKDKYDLEESYAQGFCNSIRRLK